MSRESNNSRVSVEAIPGGASPGRRSLRVLAQRLRRHWWIPGGFVAVLATGMVIPVSATPLHLPTPSEGLVCTNGTTKQVTPAAPAAAYTTRSFVLTARDGYITTPDGNSIYMWSYSQNDKDFQYPGPFLCANEGDHVTVSLHNSLPVPTSMVFTGVSGVKVNGAVAQPDSPTVTSLVQPVAAATPGNPAGGQATYTFIASHPGTFLYESGTDAQLQVQMGLIGGMVVRPFTPGCKGATTDPASCTFSYKPPGACADPYSAGTVAYAYDNPYSKFNSCQEYVHLLSEIDPDLHHSIELAAAPGNLNPSYAYDWAKYNARYYMINGRTFPDDVSPNGISNLPTQPYGALIHVQPRSATNPNSALIRYLNAGPVGYPFHPHSNHETTVGIDGHELVTASGGDASYERFALVVAPGQTIDAEFTWVDAQAWNPTTNPVGVPVPDQQDRFEGPYWNGTPYLGDYQPLSTGVTRYNQCGEFLHVAHSHALFQVTNFGFSGGGMLTMVRVDPPPGLQTQFGTTCTQPGRG